MRPTCWTVLRAAAGMLVVRRLARAARRRPPVQVSRRVLRGDITVVVPARDEAMRIGPLLDAIVAAPGVAETIVVDDESTDATAALAADAGATVVQGRPPPPGWVGKAWALQQGIDAATGEWVVLLDADARPNPALPQALVDRADTDNLDLLTAAGRFDCPTAPLRWLHPAMLTTLVYRAAPPGAAAPGPVHRRMGNGQCMVARRSTLLAIGGLGAVAHHTVEDVALVRALASAGFAVEFLDAASLLTVRMYESARQAWTGWARSLSLPEVDAQSRRWFDLGVVFLAQVLPMLRLLSRRADALDIVLVLARLGTLVGTRSAYERRGAAYWLSPLADPVAVLALARGVVDPRRRWRGRTY